MQKRGFEVTDEYGANPDRFERKVAKVLTTHFKSDIVMLRKTQSTSPDMLATRLNQIWEIKNIKGDSKHTIQHNLSDGKHQSRYVVISLYRSKMRPSQAISRIRFELQKQPEIRHLILVTREKRVVVLK